MYPQSLALVDKDLAYSLPLVHHLRGLGIGVATYLDGHTMMADADAFKNEFFVGDFLGSGLGGVELIQALRHRSNAGILVVTGHVDPNDFGHALDAGADMHLAKPQPPDHIAAAIRAIHRRSGNKPVTSSPWRLHRLRGELLAPDGACISLSDIDCSLLDCFVDADGQPVPRQTLANRLGRHGQQGAEGLNAVIYRLRRRIERATPLPVPLQSKSRVGYFFKSPLHIV
jgi:two-component system, OmpR family, response regulator